LAVTSDSADDGILLPANEVDCAFGVTFGLRGFDLSFAGGVLLLARLCPRLATGHITDILDDSALG